MKKTALWLGAVTVVAGIAMQRPVSAAEMFADVPREHWAYSAVNNLQERGIVIGYPDGTFGGKRAMTRYEFAVAIDRLVDWVNRTIKENGGTSVTTPPSTEGMTQAQVETMINDKLRGLPTKEDLETVRRLSEEFKDELTALGTNVEALRHDLDGLKARVGAIEERLNRWSFSGELNAIGRGERGQKTTMPGFGNARRPVIDLDSRTDNNGSQGLLQNAKALYSLDLGVTGRVSSGVTANALFNIGNYLPWVNTNRQNPGVSASGFNSVGGYASDISTIPGMANAGGPGAPISNVLANRPITQGNQGKDAVNTSYSEFTPAKVYLSSPVRDLWFMKDNDVSVGKLGVQFTPYTLRKVDPDSYTNVTLTDNGDIIGTGAVAHSTVGPVHMTGYAMTHYTGRTSGGGATNSGDPLFISWGGPSVLSAITYGAMPIDQSMGVHGTAQFGRFKVGGTYLEGGVTAPIGTPGSPYSNGIWVNRANKNNNGRAMVPKRAQVFGAELSFPLFSKLSVVGEFASSNLLAGTRVGDREGVYSLNKRNAYDAKLNWGAGRLNVAAGYKQVDPFFGAPGAWGNIGRWKNPTNIKGFNGSLGYNLGPITLKASIERYKSVQVDLASSRNPFIARPNTFFTNNFQNKIDHHKFGASYNLSPSNSVDLGWEEARIRPYDVAAKAKETYWTIGVGHTFNQNTLVKVIYQMVDYKDNGAGLYTVPGGRYKGGIGVTQLSVRF